LDAKEEYCIHVSGSVNADWSDSLGGMTITTERLPDGTVLTTLRGKLPDQSALVGTLNALHDLGIPLVSVERVTH
jgi:hypothetical protein